MFFNLILALTLPEKENTHSFKATPVANLKPTMVIIQSFLALTVVLITTPIDVGAGDFLRKRNNGGTPILTSFRDGRWRPTKGFSLPSNWNDQLNLETPGSSAPGGVANGGDPVQQDGGPGEVDSNPPDTPPDSSTPPGGLSDGWDQVQQDEGPDGIDSNPPDMEPENPMVCPEEPPLSGMDTCSSSDDGLSRCDYNHQWVGCEEPFTCMPIVSCFCEASGEDSRDPDVWMCSSAGMQFCEAGPPPNMGTPCGPDAAAVDAGN